MSSRKKTAKIFSDGDAVAPVARSSSVNTRSKSNNSSSSSSNTTSSSSSSTAASASSKSSSGASWWPYGGLYPSVMISDLVNVIGHLLAAHICYSKGNYIAAVGFLSVAVAAAVGTYRFGFDESFEKMNGDLADLAAFVGLPLVGLQFFKKIQPSPFEITSSFGENKLVVVLLTLATLECMSRSMHAGIREVLKIVANLAFYVGPVLYWSYSTANYHCLMAMVAFVIAGVVIKPERNQFLLGMRKEDWFHYIIAVAAVFVAKGVVA